METLVQTIFVYGFFVVACTSSLLSNYDECVALFEFKQTYASFDVGGFQNLESDCCLWDGVACSNKNHVTGLDLSQRLLRGPIDSNSTLFNLVNLQFLNLSMNDFAESQIPSEIVRLKQLRSLDLSKSNFNGQVPNEISQLVKMTTLDLSWNLLELQSRSLENMVKNLTSLQELHLSGVYINSSVPRLLANLSSLKSIKLQNCYLHNEFPSAIFHLPKLKFLNIPINPDLSGFLPEFHNNSLLEHINLYSTGFAGLIPESISNLNHLGLFSVSICFFSGYIPGSFSNLTQLTRLALGGNEFTGPVPSLASLSKLVSLELTDNHFANRRFPDWLSKLTNLDLLYLNRMNIYDEIPPFLANLTKLTAISMNENFIFGHIPSWFMNLTQLRAINLRRNQLQGQISSSFSNFKSLEYLSLQTNNFSGTVSLDTFAGIHKLETLHLSSNRISFVATNNYTDDTLPQFKYLGLSSCNMKKFPAFLRFQRQMEGLFLDGNKIDGLVPEWIWNNSQQTLQLLDLSLNFLTGFHQNPYFLPLVRLEVIVISHNQLAGRLPIPPKSTIFYDVSNNNLTGNIPQGICELKSLRVLDLSFNNLTGTISPCLSNFLFYLDLKRNNFHGPLMNTFAHGSPLKRIDLSENYFMGQVSKSFANCTNLEVLALGDNSFNDVFPFWLGSLAELQVLILRSNKFYGPVQGLTTNSSQFLKLRILDLSNNGFSGELPDKMFQTWNAMKSVYVGKSSVMTFEIFFLSFQPVSFPYTMTLTNKGVKREYWKILNLFTAIDLSCNKFEGQMPQSLQDLHGLQSLNLSNNYLTGYVLPSLGKLENLESLDLSHNELSGEIPQQLVQLGFLSMLNVSFNNLIPQGKQFNTFENISYMGNPRLCGEPLSKECQNAKAFHQRALISMNLFSQVT